MAENRADISGFVGSVWEKDILSAQKKHPSLWPLFRYRAVPRGVKTSNVPIFTVGEARDFTPGAGLDVTLDTGTSATVALVLDKYKQITIPVDNFEEVQSAVEVRQPIVDGMVQSLNYAITKTVLDTCAAYTSLPAAQKIVSTAKVNAEKATVAAEIENLVIQAVTKLEGLMGVAGALPRFLLFDSYLYNMLMGGSTKQSPENGNYQFAAITGAANPIIGTPVINAGTTSRTYSEYTTDTTFKVYLAVPEAIAVGLQVLPTFHEPQWSLLKRTWFLGADTCYGVKEGNMNGFIEISVKVNGDLTLA